MMKKTFLTLSNLLLNTPILSWFFSVSALFLGVGLHEPPGIEENIPVTKAITITVEINAVT